MLGKVHVGDKAARDALFAIAYDELKKLATRASTMVAAGR